MLQAFILKLTQKMRKKKRNVQEMCANVFY